MFGFEMTFVDWLSIVMALGATIYALAASNPHAKDTPEYQSLRLCRIGLVLCVWSFGFGLLGFAWAVVAFVLGIIGIVKGRTGYGILVVTLSVILPIAGLIISVGPYL